jgi:hypothetical protein
VLAADTLGKIRPKDDAVQDALNAALRDPDPAVRAAVDAALKRFKQK